MLPCTSLIVLTGIDAGMLFCLALLSFAFIRAMAASMKIKLMKAVNIITAGTNVLFGRLSDYPLRHPQS